MIFSINYIVYQKNYKTFQTILKYLYKQTTPLYPHYNAYLYGLLKWKMFSFCYCYKHVTKCKEQQLNKFTQRMRCRSNFPVLHNKNNTIKTNNCLRIERQKQNERIRSSRYADNRGPKNSVYNFTRHAEKKLE